jgi:protein-disulfide isomerase
VFEVDKDLFMQRKTIYAIAAAALLALLTFFAVIFGWIGARSDSPDAAAVTLDASALVRVHSPSEGSADAPVVIVEFFDPACDTCSMFYPMVKQLMAQHPGKIRLVMRYAPFHQGSDKVVAVLEAARRQGKFWPTLEALLSSQPQWVTNHVANVDNVWPALKSVGLNLEQLAFDKTSPELQQVIAQDLRDANTLGVTQTPEYFVNGKPLPSFGFEQLVQLVNAELAR